MNECTIKYNQPSIYFCTNYHPEQQAMVTTDDPTHTALECRILKMYTVYPFGFLFLFFVFCFMLLE